VPTTVVAIGGGGTDVLVRDFLVSLTGKSRPRLLHLDTASPGDPAYQLRAVEFFSPVAEVTRVEFFPWPPDGLRDLTLGADLIFVGGGNTANMLAVWRVHGFDAILRDAFEQGIVLAGSSAGMLCWFDCGITDSFGPQLAPLADGLGFLTGSACPHYDDEELRRPLYTRLVGDGALPPGHAADAGVGLVFVDGGLQEVVAPREGATGYRVDADGETSLPARLLV
jgi:peptidase E